MIQQEAYVITNLIMLLDGLLVIGSGYIAYYLNYEFNDGLLSMPTDIFVASILIVMFVNNYTFNNLGLYKDARRPSRLGMAWDIIRANVINFSVLSVFIFIFNEYNYPRQYFIYFAVISTLALIIARLILHFYIFQLSKTSTNTRKIIIVGNLERGKFVSDLMEKQLSWGHEVIGRVTTEENPTNGKPIKILGSINHLAEILKNNTIDEVIFAFGHEEQIDIGKYINICKRTGIPARILPSLWREDQPNLMVERCQGVPFLIIKTDKFHPAGLLYKRLLDILGSIIGTTIFLFLYPFVGIAIKLESTGPVLFTQTRMGQNGRTFKIYKFRTMFQDADKMKNELVNNNEMNGAIFKIKNDPRITRVGSWLRKTSLDEVPQFLNILRGEMSLVGTRPPTLEEVEHYKSWHLRRLSIKPGLTGLWQISGRNQIKDFDEIVRLDCQYLEQWRLMEDIRIIIKTILVVLKRKGAI